MGTDAKQAADIELIRRHIDGLFNAFIRKDLDAIQRGHTTDWQGFQVGSRHLVRGIEEYMDAARQTIHRLEAKRYEMLDCDIKVHGDIGVVFYLARYVVADGQGGERDVLLRSVDIYRREGEGWNQCGSNICPAPAE